MTLALRFISGKYQGGEFPLEDGREIFVGRSSELGMVLVEEMVSRKHARIIARGGTVEIEDLGSTNGTFVNGERISKATAAEGDRILIGSNILRVIALNGDPSNIATAARTKPETQQTTRKGVRRFTGDAPAEARMSGALEDIPLPDLLQLFGSSKKDGVLWVDNAVSVGRIVLRGGIIEHAQIDAGDGTPEPLSPLKALYRVIAWETGVFELDPPNAQIPSGALGMSVHEALMEAFRQKDELAQLQARLPPTNARLELNTPIEPMLRALTHEELDVLQAAINRGLLGAVVDTSPMSDLDTAQALVRLIERGYLRIAPAR
jgi:pSer/pThr/pTyr-binding forkhead associated (FHA) protein